MMTTQHQTMTDQPAQGGDLGEGVGPEEILSKGLMTRVSRLNRIDLASEAGAWGRGRDHCYCITGRASWCVGVLLLGGSM